MSLIDDTLDIEDPDPPDPPLPPSGPLILESNRFPLAPAQDGWLSVEASVAGAGLARVGVVFFNPAGIVGRYEHSDWITCTSSTSFQPLKTLVPISDNSIDGLFRLEFRGPECWVDNVMVDNNAGQLGYFDGDWYTGMPGDFSWYGPRQRSYSLYYNDRRNIDSWLFGYNEMGPKDGIVSELTLATVGSPPPSVEVPHTATIREVRDILISNSELTAKVVSGGVVEDNHTIEGGTTLGQVTLNDLTTVVRHHGAVWDQVPEGAQVVPQWDDVHGFQVPSWPGDLYIPLWDYQDGSSASRRYKTTVTAL